MSTKLKQSLLKVAQQNPEFAQALTAELGKTAGMKGWNISSFSFSEDRVHRLMSKERPNQDRTGTRYDGKWSRKVKREGTGVLGLKFDGYWETHGGPREGNKVWKSPMEGFAGVLVRVGSNNVEVEEYARINKSKWFKKVDSEPVTLFRSWLSSDFPRIRPSGPHLKITVGGDVHTIWTAEVTRRGKDFHCSLYVGLDSKVH